MPNILVVDDSEFDLSIIQKVFRTLGHWNAEFVSDGEMALSRLKEKTFDLLLTDLHMPGMSGLELLKCVHEKDYNIPVVVMTSKGSEESAIKALRCGAANYIIKKQMVKDLPDIVEVVMRSQHTAQLESQLLAHLICMEFQFSIPNDRNLLNAAVKFIQNAAHKYGRLPSIELTRLAIGLEEALSNAMIHGNLEVSSELRLDGSDSYETQIKERSGLPPYCNRPINISVCIAEGYLTCTIRDHGPGFDASAVLDPTDPEALLRPCGRGMLLIRSFMDDVQYNDLGNEIILKKKVGAPVTKGESADSAAGPTAEEIAHLCSSSAQLVSF